MSSKYIVQQSHEGRLVPRCDLPGSPYSSRKTAKAAASRAGITNPKVIPVRRTA